jgi:hypothetical protein
MNDRSYCPPESRTPKHGDVRNPRSEASVGPSVDFCDATTGEVVRRAPVVTLTQSVSERWCASCHRWVEVRGILGRFDFDFQHPEGHAAS